MFRVDNSDIKDLESELKTFKERAVPFATRNTLNLAAFDAMKRGKAKARTDMVLRNKFTERSIQVEQARTLNVAAQESVVGSTQDYMEDQEFGATKTSGGKKGVPIPTTTASGEGMGAQPRRRLPRAANKLSKVQLSKRTGGGFKSRKQEVFVRVLETVRSGKKFMYLDTGRKQAIYKIQGRGRVDKQGRIAGVRMRMVYDLSRRTIGIPRSPWLKPSVDDTSKQIPEFYRESLIFQLKKHNLFRG